jgi:cytochrome c553
MVQKIVVFIIFLIALVAVVKSEPVKDFKRCIACHGKSAEKVPPGGAIVINELTFDQLNSTLQDFKSGKKKSATMTIQTKTLTVEQLEELSTYIPTLKNK